MGKKRRIADNKKKFLKKFSKHPLTFSYKETEAPKAVINLTAEKTAVLKKDTEVEGNNSKNSSKTLEIRSLPGETVQETLTRMRSQIEAAAATEKKEKQVEPTLEVAVEEKTVEKKTTTTKAKTTKKSTTRRKTTSRSRKTASKTTKNNKS